MVTQSFRRFVGIALIALGPYAASAEEGAEAPAVQWPKYNVLRYNEDWSVLAGQETSDWWDGLKYIPLSDDGDVWISVGGQARLRYERWNNWGFSNASSRDDEFLITRLFLHVDAHIGEHVRVFVEGKSAFSTDGDGPVGTRGLEIDELALHNAFVDIDVPLFDGEGSFMFRVGRQELLFGKQRLVSPLDWANTRRTFDGFRGTLKVKGWTIDGFYTRTVPVQKYDFNDQDANTDFYGVYATGKCPATGANLDLYWLVLDREMATFNGTMGREHRHTIGGRVWGKIGDTGLDYDVEGAHQFGDIGSGDIDAYMIASEVGYRFANCPWNPRIHLGFDYASGDNSMGGDVQTFNQLFPLGHAYLGWIDVIGRQNIVDITPGVAFKPFKKTLVKINYHFFWLAEAGDALYNAGGGVVRASGLSNDRWVGSQFDLLIKQAINSHLVVIGGYSHFFADDFLHESGAHRDVDFFYLTLQYTF